MRYRKLFLALLMGLAMVPLAYATCICPGGWNYIGLTGQSNTVGLLATPALDTVPVYPFQAFMFANGLALGLQNNSTVTALTPTVLTGFAPLVEGGVPNAGGYETIASSVVDNLNDRGNYPVLVANTAVGNQDLATVCAGAGGACSGTPGAMWTNALDAITSAATYTTHGGGIIERAQMMIQGERDDSEGTSQSTYSNELTAFQSGWQPTAQAVTGQSAAIPLFLAQISNWTGNSHTTSVIPLAQLATGTQANSNVYLVAPQYFLVYTNTLHIGNTSERLIGEYFWQAYASVVQGGATTSNAFLTYPTSVSIAGAVITVTFNVPVPPLVLDTTSSILSRTIPTWTNDGFAYTDNSSPPSISSVALGGNACSPVNTCVQITLSGTPTATAGNRHIEYAYVGTSGATPGTSSGAGGNLRDSNTVMSRWGYGPLYNWAATFNVAF